MKPRLIRHLKPGNMGLYFFGLTMAAGIKYYYSNASSDGLLWILYPTAAIVEFITGLHFVREANTGFVDYGSGICIAPACSGVNFLIISFCVVFFSFAVHVRSLKAGCFWLGVSMLSAYLLTIAVNSLRIIIAVFLIDNNICYGWFTSARIHRIEGAVVYFSVLYVFYLIMRKAVTPCVTGDREENLGKKIFCNEKVQVAIVPLFWYLLIALVAPVLNGSYRKNGTLLIEHIWMVGLSCLSVFLIIHWIQLYSKRIMIKIRKNTADSLYGLTKGEKQK